MSSLAALASAAAATSSSSSSSSSGAGSGADAAQSAAPTTLAHVAAMAGVSVQALVKTMGAALAWEAEDEAKSVKTARLAAASEAVFVDRLKDVAELGVRLSRPLVRDVAEACLVHANASLVLPSTFVDSLEARVGAKLTDLLERPAEPPSPKLRAYFQGSSSTGASTSTSTSTPTTDLPDGFYMVQNGRMERCSDEDLRVALRALEAEHIRRRLEDVENMRKRARIVEQHEQAQMRLHMFQQQQQIQQQQAALQEHALRVALATRLSAHAHAHTRTAPHA